MLMSLRLAPVKTTLSVGQSHTRDYGSRISTETPFSLPIPEVKSCSMTFWATWCEYCLEELPYLERLKQEYGARGLSVAAVLEDANNVDLARDIRTKNALTCPVLLDEGNRLSKNFTVQGLPFSVLVDRHGKIQFIHLGFAVKDVPTYEKEIRQLLEES